MPHAGDASPSQSRSRSRTVAVILCAGQGTRMGAGQNKVFLPILGKPLLVYTIEAFQRARAVDDILLVAHPNEVDYCREEIVRRYGLAGVREVIAGGATRHQSEERALDWLRARIEASAVGVVLIHDGARPFVPPEEIDALAQVAAEAGGALLASAVEPDTVIARVDEEGYIAALLAPEELWRAQTPQAFEARTLLAAYDAARAEGFEGTDTASTYERAGHEVRIVPGSADNFKVTTPHDLLRAEQVVRQRAKGAR